MAQEGCLQRCKEGKTVRKVKNDASVLLLLLIVLLLAAGIYFAAYYLRPDPVRESIAGERVINTLFVIENEDSSADRYQLRPLASYVLMYSPATRRAAIIDIPGSLGQVIQRVNRVDRIDSVYDPRRITPFKQEIEVLLGIEISFHVVITLENLGKITDLIKGVELFIPAPVNEYQDGQTHADGSPLRILFPSGINRLDGDKAKVYITYELPEENSELAIFRRQRFFMGFINRLGEQNEFLNNQHVARTFHSLIRTGNNRRIQARLFDEFAKIDTSRVSIQSVGGNVREVSGQALIFPHWDGSLIKEIVRQTLAGLAQPAENMLGDRIFTVEILNGTPITGLAGRTAELFRGFGYEIISIGNADRNDYDRTVVIDRSGYQNVVRAFADIIRCTNIRYDSPEFADPEIDLGIRIFEHRADITLILGRDFNGRHVTN
jgi:anionic cell wall polymer biosynthesis LytR-Cps2A-Psr (LCP) family protein